MIYDPILGSLSPTLIGYPVEEVEEEDYDIYMISNM